MEKFSLVERITFYVREHHPEVFDKALEAIAQEDIEAYKKQNNIN